jgi:hypothetical protein
MYIMTTPYTICDYLSRKGPCGKRCFGGRCRTHRKSESLTPCRNGCGKGTASISGFCAHVETCGWRQNDELARMRAKARGTRPCEPATQSSSDQIALAQATALMATQHAALLEATAALMATQQALMQLSLAATPSPPAVPHLPLRSSYRPSTCAPQASATQASEVEDNSET